MKAEKIIKELKSLENKEQKKILQRFFKTNKGEYGEGDIFLGIKVPILREISKKYLNLSFNEIQKLLDSNIHENRLFALYILTSNYQKNKDKKNIYDFYIKNTHRINNWDLVDISCYKIVGDYLLDKEKSILYDLANSNNLWERRISIISTLTFIKNKKYEDTLKISKILLKDEHDLIHKAVGWMLRELGKVNLETEEQFLKKYYKQMPRTMLRYAIEKFDKDKKDFYMKK